MNHNQLLSDFIGGETEEQKDLGSIMVCLRNRIFIQFFERMKYIYNYVHDIVGGGENLPTKKCMRELNTHLSQSSGGR